MRKTMVMVMGLVVDWLVVVLDRQTMGDGDGDGDDGAGGTVFFK